MAPRGRGRPRKGQTRKDAAIDAMKSYGFSEELIVSTIGELLDVYGLDGWPFIEETAYKVLLDNLLEKVEKQEKDKENRDNEGIDDTLVTPVGSSTTAPGPSTQSNREAFPVELPQEAESGVTEVRENPKLTEDSGSNAYSSNAEGEGCSRKEEAAKASPKRRRRPYHGWISDSEEPLELIELKPARFEELFSATNVSKKRKTRWDVMPEDIRAFKHSSYLDVFSQATCTHEPSTLPSMDNMTPNFVFY